MKTVDIIIATPSMLSSHDPIDYPNLKVVAVVGEHCPRRKSGLLSYVMLSLTSIQGLADAWADSVEFYNCWGHMEVSVLTYL